MQKLSNTRIPIYYMFTSRLGKIRLFFFAALCGFAACLAAVFIYLQGYIIEPKATDEHGSSSGESAAGWLADYNLNERMQFFCTTMFMDGGSQVFGFVDAHGKPLYMIFYSDMDSEKGQGDYRRCWLQRSFNDKQAVEVRPGSALEQRLLLALQHEFDWSMNSAGVSLKAKVLELLKTRNKEIYIFEAIIAPME